MVLGMWKRLLMHSRRMNLENRYKKEKKMQIVMITGSGRSGGLGFETAKQLGKMGYRLIMRQSYRRAIRWKHRILNRFAGYLKRMSSAHGM